MLRWLNGFVMGTLLGMCINLVILVAYMHGDSKQEQIKKAAKRNYRSYYSMKEDE